MSALKIQIARITLSCSDSEDDGLLVEPTDFLAGDSKIMFSANEDDRRAVIFCSADDLEEFGNACVKLAQQVRGGEK